MLDQQKSFEFRVGVAGHRGPLIVWLREYLHDRIQSELQYLSRKSGFVWRMRRGPPSSWIIEAHRDGQSLTDLRVAPASKETSYMSAVSSARSTARTLPLFGDLGKVYIQRNDHPPAAVTDAKVHVFPGGSGSGRHGLLPTVGPSDAAIRTYVPGGCRDKKTLPTRRGWRWPLAHLSLRNK